MTYIIILAVIFIVALIAMAVSNSDEKKKKESAILSRKDFVESKVVKDDTASFHFAVDETRQEVFVIQDQKQSVLSIRILLMWKLLLMENLSFPVSLQASGE